MNEIFEIDVSAAARVQFPGARVLAMRLPGVGSVDGAGLDWSANRAAWTGVDKDALLTHPSIAPYANYYQRAGINPRKHLPSVANFIHRAFGRARARLPRINEVVDTVNWVAVSTMTSLGAFDAAGIEGPVLLDLSGEDESYEPVGGQGREPLPAGLLVLRDSKKVLSLFSIRDTVHTATRDSTSDLLLLGCVLPPLDSTPVRAALQLVAQRLGDGRSPALETLAGQGPWFDDHGGCFIAETLSPPVSELTERYQQIIASAAFQQRYRSLLKHYVGRATPLTLVENFSREIGVKTYLKREDLAHTGAHKINNALGQALLAQMMGKRRVVAETGAGQHGVATAAACALLGIECVIYMGLRDMQRQALNVQRIRLMGARVVAATGGTQTLKDAINDALRDWVANADTTYYLLGSALGPHPYPAIVRYFQSVIGDEARQQFAALEDGALPDALVACVGGGSNAIGLFSAFIEEPDVQLFGVEAAGQGESTGNHSIRFGQGGQSRSGVLQGCRSYVLQDANGQIGETHSIAPGLDYPMVGPEHAQLRDSGRANYLWASDDEALQALQLLSRCEGIIPALESAHALAGAIKVARQLPQGARIIINLSGRGDKDMQTIAQLTSAEEVPQ
ncbi:tryptophan synthase subunit beta [Pseudomonas sp. Z3-6]